MSTKQEKKQGKGKFIGIIVAIGVVAFLLNYFGVMDYIKIENLPKIRTWIEGFGMLGPIVYILLYIAACVFFLPGLPIALVAGVAFGPIWGTVWCSIGSVLGATAAFLVARYAARDMIEAKFGDSDQFKKIDKGVEEQGWRMLMITRMVPIFPFNVQNYVYGLTKIKLVTYVLVSWITMLPAAIAFCFAGGSVANGTGNLGQTFMYLGIAAIALVFLSLIPKLIQKKNSDVLETAEDA
ncbi:TVP38/TMEM64 family protein [Selenihalanaerobacter shriftii]|uniref:TVP38/TMEM64 family membrane protein n=1 Tax=Selenihalanaerobacter shriftii TaxID=142842 RepID=A0A1T4K582_9FIRM|nr:TVP38/TMEM64 family protein [Selenihalanaerobacter shriftii]SJZ37562.1 Uncharacterized membrane protein YdjX, TVP38/TMEM64 family, SNARE-associated domain [Selenihalanaerobacter shriftii]